jgi:branched-chain amino acid transport system permease protein
MFRETGMPDAQSEAGQPTGDALEQIKSSGRAIFEVLQGKGSVNLAGCQLGLTHLGIGVLIVTLTVPLWMKDEVVLRTMIYIGLYSILTLSLNIITGWAGQFSMAHSAFYGIGAYASALMAMRLGAPVWVGMFAGGLLATLAAAALGLPTLRLSGPYLALATIGFAEVFRILLINAVGLTRGPYGLVGIPRPCIGDACITGNKGFYYLILGLLALTVVTTHRLIDSRAGRAWVAIREDEQAAKQMGVDTTFWKVAAFMISAFPAGVAGAFFAHYMTYIAPDTFTGSESTVIMSMMVLGGMASIPGSIVGAALLLTVERAFAFLFNYRALLYGAVLAGCVVLRPQGLLGGRAPVLRAAARRRREEKQMGTLLERAATAVSHDAPSRVATEGLSSVPRPSEAELSGRRRLLEVQGLCKAFGGLKAVDNLDFYVREGEILSIIGPNGSGKTTVLNLVIGALQPDEGRILLEGQDVCRLPAHERAAMGLTRTFQEIRLFYNMTVEENLLVAQHTRLNAGIADCLVKGPRTRGEERHASQKAIGVLELFADRLLPRKNDYAITLSYANRRRCEIARALATEPKLLMLDEPCAGMNPSERVEMAEIIARLRHQGHTILLVEHHMGVVMDISDRVVVLDHGRCICEGKPDVVQTDEEVCLAYLGRTEET